MTLSSSWKPSARLPRTLSSRLTLQPDGLSSVIGEPAYGHKRARTDSNSLKVGFGCWLCIPVSLCGDSGACPNTQGLGLQKKRQHSFVGATPKVFAARSVRNKDVETAPGNHGRDIPAAKSQAAVSREHRVLQHAWLIVIRVNRAGSQVIGSHRVVRRERSGDNFINADACARQRAIQPSNKSGAVRHVGSIEQCGLLH